MISGTLTGLDSASRSTADTFIVYMVDATRAVVIETDNVELIRGIHSASGVRGRMGGPRMRMSGCLHAHNAANASGVGP
jgi:hypothetical protein